MDVFVKLYSKNNWLFQRINSDSNADLSALAGSDERRRRAGKEGLLGMDRKSDEQIPENISEPQCGRVSEHK